MISPNLLLNIPSVNNTPGPQYALDLQSCFNRIDEHDHTEGLGVPVDLSCVSVTNNFDLQSNGITNLKSIKFVNQIAINTSSSLGCVNNDLYWVNGTNTYSFPITIGGSIAVTGGSGFPGLPSGNAKAEFIPSPTDAFLFQSNTNVAATNDNSDLTIRNASISSNGITLKAPTPLASDYDLTFPLSTPLSTKILNQTVSGNIQANYDVDNTTINISSNNLQVIDGSVTNAKLAPGVTFPGVGNVTPSVRTYGNYTLGPAYSYASTGPATVATITITTSAPNKMILITSFNQALNGSGQGGSGAGSSELSMWFTIQGTTLPETQIGGLTYLGQLRQRVIVVPYFCATQDTYTIRFKVQCVFSGGATIFVHNQRLWASEIG